MSTRVTGAQEFIQATNNMLTTVPAKARAVVRQYTTATQQQAQRLEPVKTGNLKRSTTIAFQDTSTRSVGTVTANAMNRGYNYGARQEFDTKLNHPNGGQAGFMSTSFQAQSNGFKRDIQGALK